MATTVHSSPAGEELDGAEMGVQLEHALVIAPGATVTHGLPVTNYSQAPIAVETNGHLTANITDPDTGDLVGGCSGWEIQPLITFVVNPGQQARIPLLVGTASFKPELGQTVPPGNWKLTVKLQLGDRREIITPPLPFTITAAGSGSG